MKKLILLSMLVMLLTVACGGRNEMQVTEVWGRPSPSAAANGAFYMVIKNKTETDDVLVNVQADVCGMVELHESFMKEDGVMGMRPLPDNEIPIPTGETVELKVGGMHVMCMNKTVSFEAGDEIPLTLTFADAGVMELMVEIREN